MRKRLIITVLIVAVVCAGVAVCVDRFQLIGLAGWYLESSYPVYVDTDDFSKYSEDFQILADYAIWESAEQNYPKDAYIGVDHSDGVKLYYSEDYGFIPLSSQMQRSLEKVDQSFSDAGGDFGSIRIYEDKIELTVDNYNFAVVYSRDDSKPVYVPSPEEVGIKSKVRKLKEDWYTISTNY